MATDLPQTIARPESTDVRYSTRALLRVMALSALVAAIAGPYVRGLTPDERIRAFAACGVWTAMVAAWIFVAARRRLSFEKLAGQVILRLPIYGTNYRWRRINLWLLSMVITACGLMCMYVVAGQATLATSIRGAVVSAFYFPSLVMAAVSAQSIALWWWGHEARLSEAGVLWDRRLLRWSQINPSWDSEREILTFVGPDQYGINLEFAVIVPEAVRDTVKSIVDDRVQKIVVPANS